MQLPARPSDDHIRETLQSVEASPRCDLQRGDMNSVDATGKLAERLKALPQEKQARLKKRTVSGLASGNALVAEALRRCGIKRVFAMALSPVDRNFSECLARRIRPIGTRQQQVA